MAELPIRQEPVAEAPLRTKPMSVFDEDYEFDDGELDDGLNFHCSEEGELSDAQVNQMVAPQTAAGPATPIREPTFTIAGSPQRPVRMLGGSSSAGSSLQSPPSSLLGSSEPEAASTPAANRKRYRAKGKPKGFYLTTTNTPWRRIELARATNMRCKFGLGTFDKDCRGRAGRKKAYDRCRRVLVKHLKPNTAAGNGSGGCSANKDQRRQQFNALSLAEKQKLYLDVLRGKQLTEEDKTSLLEFGGFTGHRGPGESIMKDRSDQPVNVRLNSRSLLVTYQSNQLCLQCDGLGGLKDEALVAKLIELPEVAKLCTDLPQAMDKVTKRNHVDKWSWSLELCLKSFAEAYEDTKLVRLHIHCCMQRDTVPFRCRTISADLMLGAIAPSHVAGCSDPASERKTKSSHGMHYYCQMPKRGKLAGGTNFPAFEAFLVNPRWIAAHVQRQKMSSKDAQQESVFLFLNVSTGVLTMLLSFFFQTTLP